MINLPRLDLINAQNIIMSAYAIKIAEDMIAQLSGTNSEEKITDLLIELKNHISMRHDSSYVESLSKMQEVHEKYFGIERYDVENVGDLLLANILEAYLKFNLDLKCLNNLHQDEVESIKLCIIAYIKFILQLSWSDNERLQNNK